MLMAFVGREQSLPSPSRRTRNSTVESSFMFSNGGTAKVALCLISRITGHLLSSSPFRFELTPDRELVNL